MEQNLSQALLNNLIYFLVKISREVQNPNTRYQKVNPVLVSNFLGEKQKKHLVGSINIAIRLSISSF